MTDALPRLDGKHIAFLSWRDTRNPEGGGAERYLEKMAAGLVARGCRVTIFCAAHAAAPPAEDVDGVRFVRRGSKLSVYARGMQALRRGRSGRRRPGGRRSERSAVLHATGHASTRRRAGPPRAPRAVARRVPRVHGPRRLVDRTALRALALPALPVRRRVTRHSGGAARSRRSWAADRRGPQRHRPGHPGRCRQVRHADAGGGGPAGPAQAGRARSRRRGSPARAACRTCGCTSWASGWWEGELHDVRRAARRRRDRWSSRATSTEPRKHEVYERAWVLALPSLKEGWGLVIGEAGMHGTPAIAYRAAGGTRESVDDGRSGLLVDSPAELVTALGAVLGDAELRARLGARRPGDEPPVHLGPRSGVVRAGRARRARGASPGRPGPGAGLSRADQDKLSWSCRSRRRSGS